MKTNTITFDRKMFERRVAELRHALSEVKNFGIGSSPGVPYERNYSVKENIDCCIENLINSSLTT